MIIIEIWEEMIIIKNKFNEEKQTIWMWSIFKQWGGISMKAQTTTLSINEMCNNNSEVGAIRRNAFKQVASAVCFYKMNLFKRWGEKKNASQRCKKKMKRNGRRVKHRATSCQSDLNLFTSLYFSHPLI